MIIGSSLPIVVAIRLVKVEIWSILIFNVRIKIHIIVLVQSVTIQFRRLFWHISYYKLRQNNFITKCDRLLLQSSSAITKWDAIIKSLIVIIITKWWKYTMVTSIHLSHLYVIYIYIYIYTYIYKYIQHIYVYLSPYYISITLQLWQLLPYLLLL